MSEKPILTFVPFDIPGCAGEILSWRVVLERPAGTDLVGFTQLNTETGEIGFGVLGTHRRRGHAVEAVRLLIEYAAERKTLAELHAFTAPWNVGARKVLKRSGFQPEESLVIDEARGAWDLLHFSLRIVSVRPGKPLEEMKRKAGFARI